MQELRRVTVLEGPDDDTVCAGPFPLVHLNKLRLGSLGEELNYVETIKCKKIKSGRFRNRLSWSNMVVKGRESRLDGDPAGRFSGGAKT